RVVSGTLILLLAATPAVAQDPQRSIAASAARAARSAAAASEEHPGHRHGALFWSGLAVGIAGGTTSVLAVTVYKATDTSTGNAPAGTYQACVARQRDQIYATSDCGALKGKNRPLLWSGVAMGGAGAALIIGSSHTSAHVAQGTVSIA